MGLGRTPGMGGAQNPAPSAVAPPDRPSATAPVVAPEAAMDVPQKGGCGCQTGAPGGSASGLVVGVIGLALAFLGATRGRVKGPFSK